MIKPVFLSIRINAPKFNLELKNIKITAQELEELHHLVHKSFFTELLNFCLSELGDLEKKKKFLNILYSNHPKKEEKALNFLKTSIKDFHIKFKKESLRIDLELAQLIRNNPTE